MDYVKFYQTVAREFGTTTAVCAVVAATVLLAKKTKPRHKKNKSLYVAEVIESLRKKLFIHWSVDPVRCFACVLAWDEYCDLLAQQDLGDCTAVAFGPLVIKHMAQLNRHVEESKE